MNAIPPSATTHCHLRFVAGTDADDLLPALRRHLDARGFESIELIAGGIAMNATRLDPAHPWAQWAIGSVAATSGKDVAGAAEPGREPAQRCFRRRPWTAHDLGAAFVSRLFPARAERTCTWFGLQRSASDHDRFVVGSGLGRHARIELATASRPTDSGLASASVLARTGYVEEVSGSCVVVSQPGVRRHRAQQSRYVFRRARCRRREYESLPRTPLRA